MEFMKYFLGVAFLGLTCCFYACVSGDNTKSSGEIISKKAGVNDVAIHELGDPDKIHPILYTSASSNYICQHVFQSLLERNPKTYELIPNLAVSKPKITLIDEGPYKNGMTLDYEIRPEAVWDNGTPVTGHDYAFSVKSVKNPKADAAHIRPYLEFIKDVVIDKENPKKFTVYSGDRYILSEEFSGYWVLPEYLYDPNKIMRKFSFKELNDPKKKDALRSNADIIAFATEYNNEKYAREKGFVVGSGPYEFVEWKTGQYITLKKKENWWGDNIDEIPFQNNPDIIKYKIIPDWTTAITTMKDEEIDLARGIRAKDFVDLQDGEFANMFAMHTPDYMAYDYIGMNMKSPIFSDKKVRKAMNYVVDKDLIRDVIMYGYGVPVVGPFHPTKSFYNHDIPHYAFNLDKAKALLDEAGWKDTDQDGIRDKVINGKKTPFKVTVKYNQGNSRRENTALMLSENGKKIGLDIKVEVREWTVFIEETKAHKFDMYVSGWVSGNGLGDPKQIWHSESYNGGSNYVGFGTSESDALIEKIRYNLDEPSRTAQYKRFQEIIYEESPYVFLNAQKNKLAFHKRFDNTKSYAVRPGYHVGEWLINPKFGFSSSASK